MQVIAEEVGAQARRSTSVQRFLRRAHQALTQGVRGVGGTVGEAVLYDPEQPSFNLGGSADHLR